MKKAYDLGCQYAKEAINSGGDDPFDAEGKCILPEAPLPGDYDSLAYDLGKDSEENGLTSEEIAEMEKGYRDTIGEYRIK